MCTHMSNAVRTEELEHKKKIDRNKKLFWFFNVSNSITIFLSLFLLFKSSSTTSDSWIENARAMLESWLWSLNGAISLLTALLIMIFACWEHPLYKLSDRSYNYWNFLSVPSLVLAASLLFKAQAREIAIWMLLSVQLHIFFSSIFRVTKGSSSNEYRLRKRLKLNPPTETEVTFNALPEIQLDWVVPNYEEEYEVKGQVEPADATFSMEDQKVENSKVRVKEPGRDEVTSWVTLKQLHQEFVEDSKNSNERKNEERINVLINVERLLKIISQFQHPYLLNFSRFIVCRNDNNIRALRGIMTEVLSNYTFLTVLTKKQWGDVKHDDLVKWVLALYRVVLTCHMDYKISSLGLTEEKVLVCSSDLKIDIFESHLTLGEDAKFRNGEKEDETSLVAIVEYILEKYNAETGRTPPDILQSLVQALKTHGQVNRLSHIVSMLDSETQNFPMITEKECKEIPCEDGSPDGETKKKVYKWGNVYPVKISHLLLPSLAVLKMIDEKREKYIIREKRICMKMNHPNIMRYYGFTYTEVDGLRRVTGLIMEYLSLFVDSPKLIYKAVTLDTCFGERSISQTELFFECTDERIYQYALQLSSALKYCHNEVGIIYRSLGPRSVLIYDRYNKLKLYDFSLSREHVKKGTLGLGAPGFQAPEMMDTLSREGYGYKVDCWSYAMLIFYMLIFYKLGDDKKYPFKCNINNGTDVIKKELEKMLCKMKSSNEERSQPFPRTDGSFDWKATHIFEKKLLDALQNGVAERGSKEIEEQATSFMDFACGNGCETVYTVMRRCLALNPERRPSMEEIHAYLELHPPN